MPELANISLTLAHHASSLISLGTFVVISLPSLTVGADGGKVYSGNLIYSFSGGNAGGFQPGTVGAVAQIIVPSAAQVKVDGSFVLLNGDFGTMFASGTLTAGTPGLVSGIVEISDAGQTKVTGV